jgi:hypothetical protein
VASPISVAAGSQSLPYRSYRVSEENSSAVEADSIFVEGQECALKHSELASEDVNADRHLRVAAVWTRKISVASVDAVPQASPVTRRAHHTTDVCTPRLEGRVRINPTSVQAMRAPAATLKESPLSVTQRSAWPTCPPRPASSACSSRRRRCSGRRRRRQRSCPPIEETALPGPSIGHRRSQKRQSKRQSRRYRRHHKAGINQTRGDCCLSCQADARLRKVFD